MTLALPPGYLTTRLFETSAMATLAFRTNSNCCGAFSGRGGRPRRLSADRRRAEHAAAAASAPAAPRSRLTFFAFLKERADDQRPAAAVAPVAPVLQPVQGSLFF